MKTVANIEIGIVIFLLIAGITADKNGGLPFLGGMALLFIGEMLKVGTEADS